MVVRTGWWSALCSAIPQARRHHHSCRSRADRQPSLTLSACQQNNSNQPENCLIRTNFADLGFESAELSSSLKSFTQSIMLTAAASGCVLHCQAVTLLASPITYVTADHSWVLSPGYNRRWRKTVKRQRCSLFEDLIAHRSSIVSETEGQPKRLGASEGSLISLDSTWTAIDNGYMQRPPAKVNKGAEYTRMFAGYYCPRGLAWISSTDVSYRQGTL